jgi:hypothetical protein
VVWFGSPHKPHMAGDAYRSEYVEQGGMADFYGEIAGIDAAVGDLRSELRALGLEDKTIFWYCSDNGGLFTETTGGRAKKGSIYEGGLRVPAVIEWPGHIAPGRITAIPANTSDIYPTLLDIAGIGVASQPPLDGVSLLPVMKGRPQVREPMGFWSYDRFAGRSENKTLLSDLLKRQQKGEAVVSSREDLCLDAGVIETIMPADDFYGRSAWLDWPWKLHRIEKENEPIVFELYNLEADPMEENDIAAQHVDRVESMKVQLESWMQSVIRSQNGGDYQ